MHSVNINKDCFTWPRSQCFVVFLVLSCSVDVCLLIVCISFVHTAFSLPVHFPLTAINIL